MALIFGDINLSAFRHVKMKAKGKSGEVNGIFIPLDANKLKEHEKGGVYFNFVGFELKNPTDYGTHILKQSFNKEIREKMTDEEKKEQPIFGNINLDNTPPATDNDAGGGKTFDQSDDLPF